MNDLHVHPTSYGYAVTWGDEPTGDAVAMVTIANDGAEPTMFICRRCCSADCTHANAALRHYNEKREDG